jgi:hypothetical protein
MLPYVKQALFAVTVNFSTTHDTTTATPEMTMTTGGTTVTSPVTASSQRLTVVTQLTTFSSTATTNSPPTQTAAPTSCYVMGTLNLLTHPAISMGLGGLTESSNVSKIISKFPYSIQTAAFTSLFTSTVS